MKRYQLYLIIGGLTFLALWILGRITYTFQYFKLVSDSNEPTLKKNEIVFTSILKKPKRMDFICFETLQEFGEKLWMFRVCGLPGDKIQIRNGILFVNGKNMDSGLVLQHPYILHRKDTANLGINPYEIIQSTQDDSLVALISEDLLQKTSPPCIRFILPPNKIDSQIHRIFKHDWNRDHFGPIEVPPDKYFLLGDNRYSAIDSRYIGFVSKEKILGTLL